MTNTASARPTLSVDEQSQILNNEVAKAARQGWTVSSVAGNQAILQRKKRIGWFWNVILSIVTGGLWLIVVIVRLVNRKIETSVISVDAYGNIRRK